MSLKHLRDSHSHLDASGPKEPSLDGTLGAAAKVSTIIARERSGRTRDYIQSLGKVRCASEGRIENLSLKGKK